MLVPSVRENVSYRYVYYLSGLRRSYYEVHAVFWPGNWIRKLENTEDNGTSKREHYSSLFGEIHTEESSDLSENRLRNEWRKEERKKEMWSEVITISQSLESFRCPLLT